LQLDHSVVVKTLEPFFRRGFEPEIYVVGLRVFFRPRRGFVFARTCEVKRLKNIISGVLGGGDVVRPEIVVQVGLRDRVWEQGPASPSELRPAALVDLVV
jgi:hypothetical protein